MPFFLFPKKCTQATSRRPTLARTLAIEILLNRFDFGFVLTKRQQATPAQTMGCFDKLCSVPVETVAKRDIQSSIECDYDINPTGLYQALERKEWKSAMDFMVEGTWRQGPFMILFPGKDPIPPEKQASMWVTRFEKDGSVRWSQIPLHAAITFGAPMALVQKLIHLYPLSVRCTDDQGMLPLHLAFKFSSDRCDATFALLQVCEACIGLRCAGWESRHMWLPCQHK